MEISNQYRISGCCSKGGTTSLFTSSPSPQLYNYEPNLGLYLSSIGLGTYRGGILNSEQEEWINSIILAVQGGYNVLDTAARYRNGLSERNIGQAISLLSMNETDIREKLFISSKAGLICNPYPEQPIDEYIFNELIPQIGISAKTIYGNLFCMEPIFIEHQILSSLERLNLTTLDCFYLHNPETIFLYNNITQSYNLFLKVFKLLEKFRSTGQIQSYGVSSWNGFRRSRSSSYRLDINRLLSLATLAGGKNHGFRFVQLPISVGMPYAVKYSIPEYIQFLGLSIMTSASAYEGNLQSLNVLTKCFNSFGITDSLNEQLPANVSFPHSENSLIQLFDTLNTFRQSGKTLSEYLEKLTGSDDLYFAAINLIRSFPEVTTALLGMEKTKYTLANLKFATYPKLSSSRVLEYKNMQRNF